MGEYKLTATGIFIIFYHLVVLIGIPLYLSVWTPSAGILWATFALILACGFSVTALYHRFYSHRTYKLSKAGEVVFLFFATMVEGCALSWAYDHRMHHNHTDTKKDPYSIKEGFWHAHILWMFTDADPIKKEIVPDLYKNKLVMYQHKHFIPLMLSSNLLVISIIGIIFGDIIGALLFAGFFRIFVVHHLTWFINSIAHTFGSKNYSSEESAVDNFICAFLTYGEGYHNYHHTFPSDYRNGVRWWHFDPTKWLLWSLSKLGLASSLKRVNKYSAQKRMLLESRKRLIENIKHHKNYEWLEKKISSISASISDKITMINKMYNEYRASKKEKVSKDYLKQLKLEIKKLKKSVSKEHRTWNKLSKDIRKNRFTA